MDPRGEHGATDVSAHVQAPALLALADWMTEDVAQRLYAARQDLSDIAHEDRAKGEDVALVNAQLLVVIRSLHEIAKVLRASAETTVEAPSPERVADDVRERVAGARVLIAQSLQLVGRSLELRDRARHSYPSPS